MPKTKDPLVAALLAGHTYQFKVSDGGDLASMRAVLHHGQQITFSPIAHPYEIQAGDIVIVRWHGANFMMHLVQEIHDGQYLIVNSLGKVNGWVAASEVIGRASQVDPPPVVPAVPEMLEQLQARYAGLIQRLDLPPEDAARLLAVVEDLGWYADRLGDERWSVLPQQNEWSFESHVWHLWKEIGADLASGELQAAADYIHHAKDHIGMIARTQQSFGGTQKVP